jgi:glucose-6-phosphate 1-dehydrogenase
MPVTATEVALRFRRPPHDVFGVGHALIDNELRFRIWPDAEITLTLAGKKPGAGREAQLQELAFAEQPGSDMRPYDRLIGAALDGNRVLFARQDTVEAAWRVVDPVLDPELPLYLSAGQLGTEGGRRPAAQRGRVARPGELRWDRELG